MGVFARRLSVFRWPQRNEVKRRGHFLPVLTRLAMCRLFPIEREDHADTNREHEDHHGNKDIVTDRTNVVKTEKCDTYP